MARRKHKFAEGSRVALIKPYKLPNGKIIRKGTKAKIMENDTAYPRCPHYWILPRWWKGDVLVPEDVLKATT